LDSYKKLGVKHIYSVSYGADITTWAYISYLKETGRQGLIYKFLKEYAERKNNLPFMVDILNCQKGCIRGTATDETIDDVDVELAINEMNKLVKNEKEKHSKNPWNSTLSLEKRWELFCEQFKELRIEDFTRKYTSKKVAVKKPSAQELDEVFESMKKHTKESRCIDCSCCGYASCEEMATAIYNGTNSKENCIHYIKGLADTERKKIEEIYENTVREQQLRDEHLNKILEQFNSLNDGVATLSEANGTIAEDIVVMTEAVKSLGAECENIRQSLSFFNEFVEMYVRSNEDIAGIANKTNLLSLNASIAATTQEVSAQSDTIRTLSEAIQDDVKKI